MEGNAAVGWSIMISEADMQLSPLINLSRVILGMALILNMKIAGASLLLVVFKVNTRAKNAASTNQSPSLTQQLLNQAAI